MKREETHYRLLPMAGAYNMRDLGGYRTIYGKHVKWITFGIGCRTRDSDGRLYAVS